MIEGLSRLRDDLGQLSWYAKLLRTEGVARKTLAARRGISLPKLPRSPRRRGSIWGVTMVRDEVDIIGHTIDHLLSQGVDELIVSDNGSVDGTRELLTDLARREPRLHLAFDREPAYFQAEKMTRLMHAAARSGADWVIPFDADEFWFAERTSLRQFFADLTARAGVGIVKATFHHMVPTEPHPADLARTTFVMDATPTEPGKVAISAHRFAYVTVGNHSAARAGSIIEGLHIAHAIYRGPAQVARKVRQGAQAVMLTNPGDDIARHWRAGDDLDDAGIEAAFQRMSQGQPEPGLAFKAIGPMVRVQPLQWSTWDPDGQVPPGARS